MVICVMRTLNISKTTLLEELRMAMLKSYVKKDSKLAHFMLQSKDKSVFSKQQTWFCTTLLCFHLYSWMHLRECKEVTKWYHHSLLVFVQHWHWIKLKVAQKWEDQDSHLRNHLNFPAAKNYYSSESFTLLCGYCWKVRNRFALGMLAKQKRSDQSIWILALSSINSTWTNT